MTSNPENQVGSGLRVAVVGPRRTRQGLGPFFASFFEQYGARVEVICGRNPNCLGAASQDLAGRLGHPVRAYSDPLQMLRQEKAAGTPIDIMVVATPTGMHEFALMAALEEPVHVLCEKPFVWKGPGSALRAEQILRKHHESGKHLVINTQWPFTLPTYFELFPELMEAQRDSLDMLLAPMSRGLQMLPDAIPHVLSLCQAFTTSSGAGLVSPILPPAQDLDVKACDIRFENAGPQSEEVSLLFRYVTSRTELDCRARFRHCLEAPRPAGYGINGHMANREIQMPDYRIFFGDGEKKVEALDPLGLLVKDFLSRIEVGKKPELDLSAVQRLQLLEQIVMAWATTQESEECR